MPWALAPPPFALRRAKSNRCSAATATHDGLLHRFWQRMGLTALEANAAAIAGDRRPLMHLSVCRCLPGRTARGGRVA